MNPTFLATTALDKFWDKTQPILFLDRWCCLHDQKNNWENLNAKILTTADLDNVRSQQAFDYTILVFEKLLPEISIWLNGVHGTSYSQRYWRIVVGPFLLWYIQVVYMRYNSLKIAYQNHPDMTTIGLAEKSYLTPINSHEFCLWAAESDAWNLQLMTQLLLLAIKPPASYHEHDWDAELKQRMSVVEQSTSFKKKTRIKLFLIKLLAKWRTKKTIGLCGCVHEFSKRNIFRLIVLSRFRILPLTQINTKERTAVNKNVLDVTIRNTLSELPAADDFTKLVLTTLQVNFPLNFIEHYQEEVAAADESFPYSPKTVVGYGWLQNDKFKFWGAKLAEQGSKLFDIQHGGGYGAIQYCGYEYLERSNLDGFITWGWKENEKDFPMPSILVGERIAEWKKKRISKDMNQQILWVVTEVDRYPAFIASILNNMRQPYFDWQARFADALTQDVFSQVTMRVRPGSKYYKYWRELLPNLNIELPINKASYFDKLCSSKILVCDNCNTTFMYGFIFNIPTILFWDKKLFAIRENAKPYFKALKDVAIYHDSPESAAKMLAEISDAPEVWWQSNAVQEARRKFCEYYANTSPRWINQWSRMLLDTLEN